MPLEPNTNVYRRGISDGNNRRRRTQKRPFWLPAPGYYFLAAAAAIAVFFAVWLILHEGGEDLPWITAGLAASGILGLAVYLREVVLRRARRRFLATQKRLDENLRQLPVSMQPQRLSLQQNADLIAQIRQKSEAAKMFGHLSEGHREVFEMCAEYLRLNKNQLEIVHPGSLRLPVLRNGRDTVGRLHKFHLLAWAEIESRNLTQAARNQIKLAAKLETAQKAINILESARAIYPQAVELIDSIAALRGFMASLKISHWIEQAERSAFKGNRKRALNLYRDALFFMARENLPREENQMIAGKINDAMEKLKYYEIGNKEEKEENSTNFHEDND